MPFGVVGSPTQIVAHTKIAMTATNSGAPNLSGTVS